MEPAWEAFVARHERSLHLTDARDSNEFYDTIPYGPVSELFFLMRRETHPMDWVPSFPSPSRKACSFPLGKTL